MSKVDMMKNKRQKINKNPKNTLQYFVAELDLALNPLKKACDLLVQFAMDQTNSNSPAPHANKPFSIASTPWKKLLGTSLRLWFWEQQNLSDAEDMALKKYMSWAMKKYKRTSKRVLWKIGKKRISTARSYLERKLEGISNGQH